ncbi:uncharacterized protein DS421_1g11920 [Arachis hypogaea]|nr:uncharacterized protein DS421_1g11920 [Arachis hypogaea]
MSRVQIVGSLPFPTLVLNLVSVAGVFYQAGDVQTMIPRDDKIIPNRKYNRPPVPLVSRNKDPFFKAPSSFIPPSSTPHAPPQSAHQLLLELLEKVDRQGRRIEQIERRNKCHYNYLKELIGCINPPLEEPDTLECTSDHSMESNHEPDCGSDDFDPTLLITDGIEDRAKL